MSDLDTRVRAALHDLADAAPDGDAVFTRTVRRITAARRRRAVAAGALTTLALAALVGVLASRSPEPEAPTRPVAPSVATTERAPTRILALVQHEIAVLSAGDGHRVATITYAGQRAGEVAAAPRGNRIAVTTPDFHDQCVTTSLSYSDADGADRRRIVSINGEAHPVLSRDGTWVAYRWSECGEAPTIGMTNLDTRANYLLPGVTPPSEDVQPLAFSPDGSRLLVRSGERYYILTDVPAVGTPERIDLPSGTRFAAFISDHELAIVGSFDGAESVLDRFELTSQARRHIAITDGRIIAMSYDAPSRTFLVATQPRDTVEVGTVTLDGASHVIARVPGLTAAAWTDAPAELAPPTTPTAPPQTTAAALVEVPNVVGMTQRDALSALRARGFDPAVERFAPDDGVFDQRPQAGVRVPAGYPVRLWSCPPTADCATGDLPDAVFTAWYATDVTADVWAPLVNGSLGPTPDEALASILAADRSQGRETHTGEVVTATSQDAVVLEHVRNLADDSSYGIDIEISLVHRSDGWAIGSVRQRGLCQVHRGGFPSENCT